MNSDSFYAFDEDEAPLKSDATARKAGSGIPEAADQPNNDVSGKNLNSDKDSGKKLHNEETATIIDYKNVTIERGERQVLKNVSFRVNSGEFCYLVGRVGSGKSSLMKTMYADIPIHEAEKASILDFDLKTLKRKKIPFLRRKIGIVFQDFQLLQDRSVAANLRFVLEATGWRKKNEIEERIEEVLADVGMTNKSYKMPHELSGGEQQRIVIARALLNRPQLILADEPTGNLDPATGSQIVKLLHDLVRQGHSVVMATHNLQLVEDFPGRIVECINKTLVAH